VTSLSAACRTAPVALVVLAAVTGCASVEETSLDGRAGATAARTDAPREAKRAAPEALRPCTRTDMIGAWQVIRMGAASAGDVDRDDAEYYPHQRYVFSSDATVRYLAAQTPITPAAHRALAAAAPAMTWATDDGGRLLIQPAGAPRRQVSTCQVLVTGTHDASGVVTGEPGDLLLTRLAEDGRAVSRRQLRRLATVPE